MICNKNNINNKKLTAYNLLFIIFNILVMDAFMYANKRLQTQFQSIEPYQNKKSIYSYICLFI